MMILLILLSFYRNSLWNDEIGLLEDTLRKSPQKMRPLFNLARVYQKRGDLERAKEFYIRAAHLSPENPDIYNNLGNVYQAMGDLDRAILFYKAGLSYKETAYLYYNLARAYENKGDREAAVYYYRQVLRIDPNDEEVKEILSELEGQ